MLCQGFGEMGARRRIRFIGWLGKSCVDPRRMEDLVFVILVISIKLYLRNKLGRSLMNLKLCFPGYIKGDISPRHAFLNVGKGIGHHMLGVVFCLGEHNCQEV